MLTSLPSYHPYMNQMPLELRWSHITNHKYVLYSL